MAARRLLHWAVEYYSAAPEPHVCVTLRGCEPHGIVKRHPVAVAERITMPTEREMPASYRAHQEVVRRAMRQSSHRWRRRVP
jgi:hypothetical protein